MLLGLVDVSKVAWARRIIPETDDTLTHIIDDVPPSVRPPDTRSRNTGSRNTESVMSVGYIEATIKT